MDKISIYCKDIDEAQEVHDWLKTHVGQTNYQQWISFTQDADWDQRGMRRTYSFKNPEHETLFVLRWA